MSRPTAMSDHSFTPTLVPTMFLADSQQHETYGDIDVIMRMKTDVTLFKEIIDYLKSLGHQLNLV